MLVIRKSSVEQQVELPGGRLLPPDHVLRPRPPAAPPSARSGESVPSRCLRKYSLPFAEEPSRLARQIVSTRGKFSGASGSSAANRRLAVPQLVDHVLAGSFPAAAASSARSSGLRSKVG